MVMKTLIVLTFLSSLVLSSGCNTSGFSRTRATTSPEVKAEPVQAVTNAVPAEVKAEVGPIAAAPAPATTPARLKIDDATRVVAIRYMDAIGIDRSMTNVVQQVVSGYRASLPRVPVAFWDEFVKSVTTEWLTDRFVQETATVYTLDELTRICEFFEAPIGRKFIENERILQMKNSQHIASFSRVLGKELESRLRARKFIF